MILIAGGTGLLGNRVTARLASSGSQVRVLSRGRHRGATPSRSSVDVVRGDVRDVATVRRAMDGASVVVSVVQGLVGKGRVSPETVDRDGNRVLIDAAAREGADVVLLSVAGAAPDEPWDLGRMKFAAEQHLARSGCRGTVIRPAAFAQTWVDVLRGTAGWAERPRILGQGDNPIPWVDVDDVAALVECAVLDPRLRGRTLALAGPELLTLEQLARTVMAANGWRGEPRRIPPRVLRTVAGTVGRVLPQVRRLCLTALVLDRQGPVDDRLTRELLPMLAATPATDVVATSTGRT